MRCKKISEAIRSVIYRTAGNFRGRKLSRIGENTIFAEKNLQIARFCSAKWRHTPYFAEKTFAYSHKNAKFAKVFSLESFPLYGGCQGERRTSATEAFQYYPVQYIHIAIEDCEDWWLSGCCSSVAEHWRLKPVLCLRFNSWRLQTFSRSSILTSKHLNSLHCNKKQAF